MGGGVTLRIFDRINRIEQDWISPGFRRNPVNPVNPVNKGFLTPRRKVDLPSAKFSKLTSDRWMIGRPHLTRLRGLRGFARQPRMSREGTKAAKERTTQAPLLNPLPTRASRREEEFLGRCWRPGALLFIDAEV